MDLSLGGERIQHGALAVGLGITSIIAAAISANSPLIGIAALGLTEIGAFWGGKAKDMRKRTRSIANALENHHLAKATADALEMVILEAGDLGERHPDFTTAAREYWLKLLEENDPRAEAFSAGNLPDRLTEVLTNARTQDEMLRRQWIMILWEANEELPAEKQVRPEELVNLANLLIARFPDAIYRAFQQDAGDGGAAFGGVVMRMLVALREDVAKMRGGEMTSAADMDFERWLESVTTLFADTSRRIDAAAAAVVESREDVKAHVTATGGDLLRKLELRLDEMESRGLGARPGTAATARVTEVWMPPVRPDPLFVGRERELRLVDECRGKLGASRVVLCGAPGIGKTALAVRWCDRMDPKPRQVLWIDCLSAQMIDDSLTAISEKVACVDGPGAGESKRTQPDHLQGALEWLRQEPDWVLIADRCDTPESMGALRKRLGAITHGFVIVTSRLQSWATEDLPFEVDELPPEEAVSLLLRQIGRAGKEPGEGSRMAGARLAAELGNLPLALVEAGNFIRQKAMTVVKYEQLFLEWRRKFRSGPAPDTALIGPGLHAAYSLAFEDRSELAREYLAFLSFYECESIPPAVVEKFGELLRGVYPAMDVEAPLLELRDHSLAEIGEDGRIRVNRIIQDILGDTCPGDMYLMMLGWAAKVCTLCDWPSRQEAEPHYRRICSQLGQVPWDDQPDILIPSNVACHVSFAHLLRRRWKSADAIQVALLAVRIIERRLANLEDGSYGGIVGLQALVTLGGMFGNFRYDDEARRCLEWADAGYRRLPQATTTDMLDQMLFISSGLAKQHQAAGAVGRARELLEDGVGRVRALAEIMPDNEHLRLLEITTTCVLGDWWFREQKWKEASAGYERGWRLLISGAGIGRDAVEAHGITMGILTRIGAALYHAEGASACRSRIGETMEQALRNECLNLEILADPKNYLSMAPSNETSEIVSIFVVVEILRAGSRLNPGCGELRNTAMFARVVRLCIAARSNRVLAWPARGFGVVSGMIIKGFLFIIRKVAKDEKLRNVVTIEGLEKMARDSGNEDIADLYAHAAKGNAKRWL